MSGNEKFRVYDDDVPEQAEKAYQKTISLDPSSRDPYIELSRLYGSKGLWDKAESELKKMIQSSKSRSQDLQLLARFYESQEKWNQAEKTYSEAVDASPQGNVAALMNLAGYQARRQNYDKALETMQNALDIRKGDLNILVSVAQLHFDFNNHEEAEKTEVSTNG